MRRRLTAMGASLGAAIVVGAAAQSPQDAPQRFRASVNVVQLDVSVLGKDRLPVRGLSAADFTVMEDGKPRPIVSFTPIDVPQREPASAAWVRDVAPDVVSNDGGNRRLIAIVMDDVVPKGDSSFVNTGTKVARAIVDQLRPSDLAAVVFTLSGRNQTFTADRQKLLDAIASYGPARAEVACELKPSHSCAVDAMDRLADVLAAAPAGRKMLFYVGIKPLPEVIEYNFEKPVGAVDSFDRPKVVMDLFRKLQAANITVDSFDISGITGEAPGGGVDDIRTLAYNTGGRAIVNNNEPWTPVSDIFRQNGSYYLLGVESDAKPGDPRLHKIQVTTSRPGLTVRTRSGYFAAPIEGPNKDAATSSPTAAVDAALDTTLPIGGIPLELSVVPFAAPSGKGATLLVFTGLHQPAPPAAPLWGRIELVSRAYDLEGQPQSTYRQNIDVRPGSNARYQVLGQLQVRGARRYDVRVAAAGEGRRGSVFADIEVPDFEHAPLALSGLVLGNGSSKPPADARLAELIPIVPVTVRTFTPRDAVVAFMRVYRRDKGKGLSGRVVATIADDRDKKVFEQEDPLGAPASTAGGGQPHRLDLPLRDLQPGSYLLTFDVSSGKEHASRSVRFSVR
jgi:VWFA-related protein